MTGEELRLKFDLRWGKYRRFLSAHPLTGAWLNLGAGIAIGYLAGIVLG